MGNMILPMGIRDEFRWRVVETAWGWCGLRRAAGGIDRCSLPSPDRSSAIEHVADGFPATEADALLDRAADLLVAYVDGHPVRLDLPVSLDGMPPFSTRALIACAAIPWGETRSYGEIAAAAGSVGAARAAGQALGRNPIPLIIPCHRVIGADGRLVGFGSGLDVKRRLLAHEGAVAAR